MENNINTWLADWMDHHRAASSIREAGDVVSVLEIKNKYLMETGIDPDPEIIQQSLIAAEYIFDQGGVLIR